MAIALKQAQLMQPVNRRSFLEKVLVGAGVFSSAAIAGSVGMVVAKSDPEGSRSGRAWTRWTRGCAGNDRDDRACD